jgi:hypothetical protein
MFEQFKSLFKKPEGPPSSQDAAARAVVLKMVITYGMVRTFSKVGADEGVKLYQIARQIGVHNAFSPKEKIFLNDANAGNNQQCLTNASWRLEALGTILWALKLIPWLPPYDEQFDGKVMGKIPGNSEIAEFILTTSLRPIDELNKARNRAELWHWRSRTRELIEEKRPFPAEIPQFKSYDEIVRFSAKAANEKDSLEIIDEDFAAIGKAYRDLTDEEWSSIRSIAFERHFALNWLCGYAPDNRWDETPTDT